MVATDTIEGTIDNTLWFHYDLTADILYLRRTDSRDAATYADEQPDGTLLLKRQDNDAIAGLTVIDWWKTYGSGTLPDSLKGIERSIEPIIQKLAA